MTNEEYIKAQKRILVVGMVARPIDVDGFLRRISETETVAPILDPTLYLRGQKNLEALKRLARAVREVQQASEELLSSVVETNVSEMQRKEAN